MRTVSDADPRRASVDSRVGCDPSSESRKSPPAVAFDLKRVAAEPAAKRAHLRWLSSAHPFCAEGRLGVQASPAACEPDPSVRPAAALDVNATSGNDESSSHRGCLPQCRDKRSDDAAAVRLGSHMTRPLALVDR